jgi:hypothetical protein
MRNWKANINGALIVQGVFLGSTNLITEIMNSYVDASFTMLKVDINVFVALKVETNISFNVILFVALNVENKKP